ncbi:hypothetical protein K8I61_01475 [bacterium]|nr:hypothetical protein [bacterium]
MRGRLTVSVCTAVLIAFAGPAFALSIVEQSHNIERYQNYTKKPMRITFDASLDPSTVNGSNVFIHVEGDPGDELLVNFSLDASNAANDTLVLTPAGNPSRWPFAQRLVLNITSGLKSAGASPFDEVYPWGQTFVANIPNDMDTLEAWDPQDPFDFVDAFANANVLVAYDPIDPENTDTAKPETIPGMGATEAWKYTAGRPDVLIAVVDDGSEKYNYKELEDNYFLNAGELPAPTIAGTPCSPDPYDCNGDGKFNIRDYDDDIGGPYTIDELIDLYSDGTDSDGNGFPDDICGWDFLRNTNEALGVIDFPEGGHGEDRARDAAGIADNGQGDKPGFCPRCSVLPIRVSASVMAEMNLQGAGVKYAYDMGASVAVFASETLSYSGDVNRMFTEISEGGMVLIGVASDEMSYHHAYSGSADDVISVKSIFPIPPIDFLGLIPMHIFGFTETYCSMWGETLHLSGSSGACSSEAAGNIAGMAGLIMSRAKDLGLSITANEVKQILTMGADDIHKFCLTFTGGHCQKGWDAHFGYGRPNLVTAFDMLGDPDKGLAPAIPPEAKFREPAWFTIFDPVASPAIDVAAYIHSRGRDFNWKLQAAAGKEPKEADFKTVANGSGNAAIDDVIAQVDIAGLLPEDVYANPPDFSFDFTVTLRLQVTSNAPGRGPVTGEDRRTVAVHRDASPESGLLEGFPIHLDSAGEGSIVTYDLDGDPDGRLELIAATADGWLVVLKWSDAKGGYVEMDGFPVDLNAYSGLDNPGDYVDAPVASPAVADLFRDGVPQIVVSNAGGSIVAVHRDGNLHAGGPIVEGFPVFSDMPDNSSTDTYAHGRGFYSEPVVANLDDDPDLEIVASAFDGKVYAWKMIDADHDGTFDRLPGFPVFAKSVAGAVPPGKVCQGELEEYSPLILGTPAVGVFDPDAGDPDIANYPSIFIGTSEVCDGGIFKTTRVYGIYHDGNANDSGSAFLPGFPLDPIGPVSDLLPLPPVTLGVTSTPAMARYGGSTWLGIGSAIWFPQLFEWDGSTMTMHTPSSTGFNALAHGSFGRLAGDDTLYYVLPISSILDSIDNWISLLLPKLEAWSLDDPDTLVLSHDMEDSNWYLGASIADISGDGLPEAIAGSGGFLVHAVDLDENAPTGWPKFTNGWSVSSPTISDVDGDGVLEVFNFVREGYLHGWRSEGDACRFDGGAPDWWTDHRDERHTGVWGTDTQPPVVALDVQVTRTKDGYEIAFTAPGDDWRCGTAAAYDIRYAASAADLADPASFLSASSVPAPAPAMGGQTVSVDVDADEDDLWFAIRSVDDAGNLSLISAPANESTADDDTGDDDVDDDSDDDSDDDASDDDDAADDDDTLPADDDDDDDDGGCCGC